jgi:1-acyl-sn-glycerol-3-phosphate acyltransferase
MIRQQVYKILSFPVFIYLYAYTAFIVLLTLFLAYLKWKKALYLVLSFWAKTVFPLMGKWLHIEGKENFDRKQKYILLANHSSMFDIVAVMAFYPNVSWFGHERLLRIPLVKQMLLMTDYIPMKFSNITNTREMLSSLEEKAKDNTVAIFPEGTRSLDGKLNSFYRGFIHLYRATGHDILPVTLNGFYKLKPKNRFYINFGSKLGVVIHPPIKGQSLKSASDDQIINQVMNILESANKFSDGQ